MRFSEVIKEAPISDIQPMGDPDPEIDYDHTGTDGFGPGEEGIPTAWTEPEKRNWLSDEPKAKNTIKIIKDLMNLLFFNINGSKSKNINKLKYII